MEFSETARPAVDDETALWQAFGLRIYRYLFRLTGERETAEDLTQETFYQALRDLRRRRIAPEAEAAWLFRIATNRAYDLFRRRRLIAWLPLVAHRDTRQVTDVSEAVSEQELVLQALSRLPRETAAMLLLKDGEGFSTHEIADMVGQNYEAVRKRMARARETFRVEYLRLKGEDA